ncbi:lycopene cyclase domain-containing protein [Arachidicoccus soli]|uniref:Lycopene cyclase domain-containing protein n=1 Tax=Arachidicoccus soli TaxID=2341117 RepID=A0A386HPG0_9BACT|nr:lycopene cyclase domain-containing protein [Arachidicoccus soli]AYD47827.1 lycopene cyclase domain-containing protein [Arachidicoccus soli]
MKTLYLWIDFFTVIVPFIFSFHPKIKFYKTWKSFFPACLLTTLMFIIWDSIFTKMGVWHFNPDYIIGIYILDLPLEEILFFICIPFSCVFTFFCLNKFYNLSWKVRNEDIFCIVFAVFLFVVGFLFIDRAYTSVTFISTGLIILLFKYYLKMQWLGNAFTVYAILIIPFLIVNGMLTGSGIQRPVVMYNNADNMHIRALTIPVEDVIYGFELFIINLAFYKLFLKRKSK